MPVQIDITDTYYLMGIAAEIEPKKTWFKNRYFNSVRTFNSDKVLFELKGSNRKIPVFVDENAGDIATSRGGYEIHEIEPSLIAPSRPMTLDDLKKRGYGEPLITGSTKAERAARIQMEDMQDLDAEISIREEWMCAQCLANYGFDMVEYVDANTVGKTKAVRFYNGSNPTAYTTSGYWTTYAVFKQNVLAMCDSLMNGSHEVADLILGSSVWATVSAFTDLQNLLDNRRIEAGQLRASLAGPGVSFVGILDFDGYSLNVFVPRETYTDLNGQAATMFDAKAACVIAPNVGESLYGAVTQIPHGETEFVTFEGQRVPKLVVDDARDMRKLALKSRPLVAPKSVAPWRYAASVIQ